MMQRLVRFFGSFGLACVLLLFLLLLTFVGTLAQVDLGLHESQRRYFDSFLAFWESAPLVGDFRLRVPLPGGQLLLWLLCINLIVGGVIRIRRNARTAGILITHAGVLVMLIAGFVKYYHSDDGHLTLWEGQSEAHFQSYYRWEVAITKQLPDRRFEEWVIPGDQFTDATSDQRTFTSDDLPFDVVLSGWMRSCQPMRKGPMFDVEVPVVDGWFLQPRAPQVEAERNIGGCYGTLVPKDGSPERKGVLWGYVGNPSTAAWNPWVVTQAGVAWAIELRRERYPLPFKLSLDKFTARFHPRTNTAASYESAVTKTEGDDSQRLVIRMNEPLRKGDYVVFQSGYGPAEPSPGDPMYSVFSIVRNPSDQWPLYSMLIMAVGLLWHFGFKLYRFLSSEARRVACAN